MSRAVLTILITTAAFLLSGWQLAIGFWGGMVYLAFLTYRDERGCWDD